MAANAIKLDAPDLWRTWTACEVNKESLAEIQVPTFAILRKHFPELRSGNLIRLKFLVRKEVRREAGLPYKPQLRSFVPGRFV